MADIAQEAGLSADEPLLSGATKVLSHLWNQAWRHAEGTLGGDAEALHDMRVALRRLRSTLQSLEGAATDGTTVLLPHVGREMARWRRRLGRLGDALGAVRDHDVLDEYLTAYCEKQIKRPLEDLPSLAQFDQFLKDERAKAFKKMEKRLRKAAKPQGLREEFGRWALGLPAIDAPPLMVRGAAHLLLEPRVGEVQDHAHFLDDAEDDIGHHEFRKSLRRLRYFLEVFSPCFALPVKGHVKFLVELQDCLGEMQDRTVLKETAQRALKVDNDDDWPDDAAQFLAYGEHRRQHLLGRARKLWSVGQEKELLGQLRA